MHPTNPNIDTQARRRMAMTQEQRASNLCESANACQHRLSKGVKRWAQIWQTKSQPADRRAHMHTHACLDSKSRARPYMCLQTIMRPQPTQFERCPTTSA
eukprot:2107938-Alexandrium_andersonii.AAC.1